MKTFGRLTLLAALIAGGPAYANDTMPGMTMPAKAGASPADTSFANSMQRMMKAMNKPGTGQVDADFVSMMLPHHQGAVDMAKVELAYGKDPVLRRMARRIVVAQQREITAMTAWQVRHIK